MTYLNLSSFDGSSEEYKTKIFKLFIEYMPVWLANLQKHFDNKDWENLANTAHTIKPNILLFGLNILEDNIITIETNARENKNLDDIGKQIKETIDIGLLAVEELKKSIHS